MWFLFGALTTTVAAGVMGYRRYTAAWSGKQGRGYEYAFGTDKQGEVQSAKIAVRHDAAFDFEIKRETGADRWFKQVGVSIEPQTGDSAFDKALYLACDDAAVRAMFMSSKALREAMWRVFFDHALPVKSVVCRAGRVWVDLRDTDLDEASVLLGVDAYIARPLQAIAAELKSRRLSTSTRRDPLFLKSVLVLALSSGLAISGGMQLARLYWWSSTPFTLDLQSLFVASVFGGIFLLVLLLAAGFALLGRSARMHLVLFELLLVGGFGAWATSYTELRDINIDFDRSEAHEVASTIVTKTSHRGRRGSRSYYLHLADWRTPGETIRVKVSASEYERAVSGVPLRVRVRDGAIGVQWVESYAPGRVDALD